MTSALRLTTSEIDGRIAAVRAVLDTTTARLVDLDADVTRRLLETSTGLTGVTAATWSDASLRHEALWQGQLALEGLLEQMAQERGARRTAPQTVLVRLDALLQGPSVALPRSGEKTTPRLTEQAAPAVSCSITEAFERMSTDFDVVTSVVAAVATAWGDTTERLRRLEALLAAVARESEASGGRRPNDLDPSTRAVGDAVALVQHDPLAFEPEQLTALEARVERIGEAMEAATGERRAEAERLVEAEVSIGADLESLVACRLQLEAWSQKIVVPASSGEALGALELALEQLRMECAVAGGPGSAASSGELRRRAARLHEHVAHLTASESIRIGRRDELRGLLEAYRAKAAAVGLAEDREIDALWRAAEAALYVAPCDVEHAEGCITRLQQAIRRLREAPS